MNLTERGVSRDLLTIGLVALLLWIFLLLGWRLVEMAPAFAAEAVAWRQQFTASAGLVTLALCLVLVTGMLFAQRTRNVQTIPGAALLGGLLSLVGVLAIVGTAPDELAAFAIAREAVVLLGCVGASALLLVIRREQPRFAVR